MAECVAQMGPLIVAVAYVPTNQSSAEDREQFYSDLDRVLTRTSGLTILKGRLNDTCGACTGCSTVFSPIFAVQRAHPGRLDNHFTLY